MVFFISFVPGLVCVVLVLLVLPNVREDVRPSLDLVGLLTMGVFLVSLIVALTQGQQLGWDSPFIQRLLLLAGVSLAIFIIYELRAKEPLVDLRLYGNVTFSAVSILMLLFFMNFTSRHVFWQVILVQRVLDYTPAQAGFALLPGSLVLATSFPLAGRLSDKFDRRLIMLSALTIFTVASYLFTFVSLDRPLSWIIWMVVLRYSCGGFVYAPMTSAALAQLLPEQVRMGSGLQSHAKWPWQYPGARHGHHHVAAPSDLPPSSARSRAGVFVPCLGRSPRARQGVGPASRCFGTTGGFTSAGAAQSSLRTAGDDCGVSGLFYAGGDDLSREHAHCVAGPGTEARGVSRLSQTSTERRSAMALDPRTRQKQLQKK